MALKYENKAWVIIAKELELKKGRCNKMVEKGRKFEFTVTSEKGVREDPQK